MVRKAEGRPDIALSDIHITHVIGQGAYGKVYQGVLPETGEFFAIKNIRKDILVENRETIQTVNLEF